MKYIFVTALVLFISTSVHAQKRFDIFYLAGNYNFMQSSANTINNNQETALTTNLSLPIVLKNSSVWFTSFDYLYYNTDNNISSTSPMDRFNLHGFIVRTGYIHRINESQAVHMLFVPRSMSDLNVSFSKSLQLGGILMYEKIKSKDLTYRIGVLYNQEVFGAYIVPLLYLDWNMTPKIKVKGLLPIYCKVYIQPSEKVSTGLHFFGLTTSYNIVGPELKNYYVDRRRIDLSLFGNVNIWDNIFLETRVGYSLSKDYRLYAENDKLDFGLPLIDIGKERNRLNEKPGGSPFIHLRMIYSVPID